jgi:hypothetical protein
MRGVDGWRMWWMDGAAEWDLLPYRTERIESESAVEGGNIEDAVDSEERGGGNIDDAADSEEGGRRERAEWQGWMWAI